MIQLKQINLREAEDIVLPIPCNFLKRIQLHFTSVQQILQKRKTWVYNTSNVIITLQYVMIRLNYPK